MIRDNVPGFGSTGLPTLSINWSGYAVQSPTKTPFNYVSSTFIQPAVTCVGPKLEASSNWVGLDGFDDSTVEQDGTFAICGGKNGTTPFYEAWYEMYPAGSVNVFSVKPGDLIATSVRYTAPDFYLTVSDLTTGKSATDVAPCGACLRNSAEWIIERPAYCGNSSCTTAEITALPDFVTTKMSNDLASSGKLQNSPITAFDYSPIEGVWNLSGTVNTGPKGFESVDTTGPVLGPPDSFVMTWNRPGGTCVITL